MKTKYFVLARFFFVNALQKWKEFVIIGVWNVNKRAKTEY